MLRQAVCATIRLSQSQECSGGDVRRQETSRLCQSRKMPLVEKQQVASMPSLRRCAFANQSKLVSSVQDADRKIAETWRRASSSAACGTARLAVAFCSCAAALVPLVCRIPAQAAMDQIVHTPMPSSVIAPANLVADLSGLFGIGGIDSEEDPVDPFTLYGAV